MQNVSGAPTMRLPIAKQNDFVVESDRRHGSTRRSNARLSISGEN
jgi:hypothetical protein